MNQDDIFSSGFLVGHIGGPFLIGLAVGLFAKKMLKIFLIVFGAVITVFFIAEHYNIIQLNDQALVNIAESAGSEIKNSGSFLMSRLGLISTTGVSATAGFALGFKIG